MANPTHDAANLWNNLVDVTVRNRGTQAANNVDVYLYWADPATNLPFPGEWRVTGIYTGASPVDQSNLSVIPQLAAGAPDDGALCLGAASTGRRRRGDDHFCLLARVEHESDPSNLNAGGWPVIAGSNNIAMRNVHVVDVSAPAPTMGLMVIGSGDDDTLEIASRGIETRGLESSCRHVGCRGVSWRCSSAGRDALRTATMAVRTRIEHVRRTLKDHEARRILNVAGAHEAFVDGPLTRLRGKPRISRSAPYGFAAARRCSMRITVPEPKLPDGVGRVDVGQRSGGKLVGGVSLELRNERVHVARYDVRRRGDAVEVTPRREAPQGQRRR